MWILFKLSQNNTKVNNKNLGRQTNPFLQEATNMFSKGCILFIVLILVDARSIILNNLHGFLEFPVNPNPMHCLLFTTIH